MSDEEEIAGLKRRKPEDRPAHDNRVETDITINLLARLLKINRQQLIVLREIRDKLP